MRNQADFFSLFGAVNELIVNDKLSQIKDPFDKLEGFIRIVDDPEKRLQMRAANDYFEAARSASNDAKPRKIRITTITSVLLGDIQVE